MVITQKIWTFKVTQQNGHNRGAPDTLKYIEIPEIPDGGSLFTPSTIPPVQPLWKLYKGPLREVIKAL